MDTCVFEEKLLSFTAQMTEKEQKELCNYAKELLENMQKGK